MTEFLQFFYGDTFRLGPYFMPFPLKSLCIISILSFHDVNYYIPIDEVCLRCLQTIFYISSNHSPPTINWDDDRIDSRPEVAGSADFYVDETCSYTVQVRGIPRGSVWSIESCKRFISPLNPAMKAWSTKGQYQLNTSAEQHSKVDT